MRSNVWSCSARTILPWVSNGMSETSSSSSVPPWGTFQHTGATGQRRRVVACLDAEQLLLETRRIQRGAVERHKRSFGATRPGMDQPGHHLLARPGRAGDEHARDPVGATRSTWLRTAFTHRTAAGQRRFLTCPQPQLGILGRPAGQLPAPGESPAADGRTGTVFSMKS